MGSQSLPTSLLHWQKGAGKGTGDVDKIDIGGRSFYANYKAPFEQLEGAVAGYPRGELPYDETGRLLCPYFDRHQARKKARTDRPGKTRGAYQHRDTYDNLGAHIAKAHGMDAPTFKAEAGLNEGTALVSEQTRHRNSAAAFKRHWGAAGNHDPHRLASIAQSGGRKGGHGRRTPQALNRRNACYLQTLLVAQQVQAQEGRLTQTLMRKRGINERVLQAHFGSWEQFLQRFGETTKGRSGALLHDQDLLDDLRNVAFELGHTPRLTDMRRYQMASRKAYENHFGSWAEACRRAGIEPNTPMIWSARAFTADEDAAVLSAYAITGSYARASRRVGISAARAKDILARYGLDALNGNAMSHAQRQVQMETAAALARRIADWPEAVAS